MAFPRKLPGAPRWMWCCPARIGFAVQQGTVFLSSHIMQQNLSVIRQSKVTQQKFLTMRGLTLLSSSTYLAR